MSAEQERLLSEGAPEDSSKKRKSSRKNRKKKRSFGVRDNLENFYNGEEVDEWSADGVILENQTALRRRLFRLPAWKGIAFAGKSLTDSLNLSRLNEIRGVRAFDSSDRSLFRKFVQSSWDVKAEG